MGAPNTFPRPLSLFSGVKTTEQLIDNIERQAAKNFARFHWTITSSKDQSNHRSAIVSFVGTDNKGHHFVKVFDRVDSLSHGLFLLDEYLTLIK